jgi:hypothetical protein
MFADLAVVLLIAIGSLGLLAVLAVCLCLASYSPTENCDDLKD